MLYLVRPLEPLLWNDLPTSLMDVASTNGADLAGLEWTPTTDTSSDDLVVSLALRHGVVASTGIVLGGGIMSLRVRPSLLMRTHRAANSSHHDFLASHGPLLEHLLPGWSETTTHLNERIDEVSNRELARALDSLAKEVDKPMKPEVVTHWLRLGGQLPVGL